jgi:hypothetical protein
MFELVITSQNPYLPHLHVSYHMPLIYYMDDCYHVFFVFGIIIVGPRDVNQCIEHQCILRHLP